jgi:hypothetical protein
MNARHPFTTIDRLRDLPLGFSGPTWTISLNSIIETATRMMQAKASFGVLDPKTENSTKSPSEKKEELRKYEINWGGIRHGHSVREPLDPDVTATALVQTDR